MNERVFRVILGAALILLLAMKWDGGIYAYIGLMLFEGITNQRIPLLVSALRGDREGWMLEPGPSRISFDSERALRLVVGLLLIISFILYPDTLWFVPWFIGMALFMAGITGVCPMSIALKKIGFRA